MSETDARRLDPRYDARFQRGYAGEGRPDAAADASETVESPHAVPQPAETVAAPAEAAREPAPPAPSLAPEREPAAPAPAPALEPPEPSALAALADPASASEPLPGPAPTVVAGDGAAARDEQDAPADSRRPDFWFLGAWVLAGGALLIGAALYWSGIMAQDFFGPTDESDRLLQLAGFTIGPALVQVGLLGLVGLLGWAGVRHARASARETSGAGSVAEPSVVTDAAPDGEGA
jgi:hypothetical protein